MSETQQNLKQELKNFLKGNEKNPKTLKVDVKIEDKNKVSVTDNKNYVFYSNNVLKILKKDNNEIPEKAFSLTLYKWNFERFGKNKEIDLDVQKYKINKNSKCIISEKSKNLLDYFDVKTLLESFKKNLEKVKTPKSKTPLKSEKMSEIGISPLKSTKKKLETKNKSAKKNITPKSNTRLHNIKEDKIVEPKKKIQKKKSAKSSVKALSVKSKKTPIKKKDENGTDSIMETLSITADQIINAPEYIFNNRKTSIANPRGISATKKTFPAPKLDNKLILSPMRKKLNKSLSKYQLELDQENQEIPKLLIQKPLTVDDILFGINNAFISWEEINFKKEHLNYVIFNEEKI
jgi:hypothetical protein